MLLSKTEDISKTKDTLIKDRKHISKTGDIYQDQSHSYLWLLVKLSHLHDGCEPKTTNLDIFVLNTKHKT